MVKNTVVKMPMENTPLDETSHSGIGPGDRLQAARIEMGLTVEDVANRLHLSVSILEALEENDFDEITAPIFVKGYLRAYARIVSLNDTEVIRQYMESYSEQDPPIGSISNTSPEISATDARIKWTTYIVVVVLAGLLVAWWWNNNQSSNDVESLGIEQSDAIVEVQPAGENAEPGLEAIAIDGAVMGMEKKLETEQLELQILEVVEPGGKLQTEAVEAEQTMTGDANPEVPSPEETAAQAVSGSGKLEIIVHADTWVDVRNADGSRLVYDLLRAGQRVTLAGQAPLTVFFGNAHGVEMKFDNKKIDIGLHTRDDNTARLTIGQ